MPIITYINSTEHFDIDIEHRGIRKTFHGTVGKYGWSYRFVVNIEGTDVVFEPDEEKNLRAIVPSGKQDNSVIREYVALIGQQLQDMLDAPR